MESYSACLVCDWPISLSVISLRFIHVMAFVKISFLFQAGKYSFVYRPHTAYPFIHQ